MIKLKLTHRDVNYHTLVFGFVWLATIIVTALLPVFNKMYRNDLILYSIIFGTVVVAIVLKMNLFKYCDFGVINIYEQEMDITKKSGGKIEEIKNISIKILGYHRQPIAGARTEVSSATENQKVNQALMGGNENILIFTDHKNVKHKLNFFLDNKDVYEKVKDIWGEWHRENRIKLSIVR